jgi:chromosome segregation ATPase
MLKSKLKEIWRNIMLLEIIRRVIPFGLALLVVGLIVTDVNGQKRRTKKSRRVANPVAAPAPTPTDSATASEPKIISTAEEASYETSQAPATRSTRSRRSSATSSGVDATQEKVDRLSVQLNALNEKMSLMEQQQRTLVDLERLTRAETRGEALRVQLRDVQTKEGELQTRALHLDYELQPEVIERTLAATGSTRPEDMREQRRRQLATEKTILQTQLNQFATSRVRLETSIANADAEADRLRARIESVTDPKQEEPIGVDVGATPAPANESGGVVYGRP